MKNRFYLACFRDNVGSNMAFHKKDGCGYTTDIREAAVFDRVEAQKKWNSLRDIDCPISADHVDEKSVIKVDHQHIPYKSVEVSEAESYVVCADSSAYCGNDRYWLTESGKTTDFLKALKAPLTEAKKLTNGTEGFYLPYATALAASRPTFPVFEFNKRTMIQGAGLVTPKHIQKEKRRVKSPKVRFNCPSCGKFHWQHHPYDFEGCDDIFCQSSR